MLDKLREGNEDDVHHFPSFSFLFLKSLWCCVSEFNKINQIYVRKINQFISNHK